MAADETSEIDPRRVRIGLAVVVVVVVLCIAALIVADQAWAKALFFAIAAVAATRAYLLYRWVRRHDQSSR